MKVSILDTGFASAEKNMVMDQQLLRNMQPQDTPLLHFYRWETPAITYGYFINPQRHLILSDSWQVARRPTGGGIIVHSGDFSFSLLVPVKHKNYSSNTLANYALVNSFIKRAIEKACGHSLTLLEKSPETNVNPHFCMAHPVPFDLMWQGKKIGGGAQRRTRNGFLHQGTISLCSPSNLNHILPSEICEKMTIHSDSLLGSMERKKFEEGYASLKNALSALNL